MRSKKKKKVNDKVSVLLKIEEDVQIMLNNLPWPIPNEAIKAYGRIIDNLLLLEILVGGGKINLSK